jgi:hypothetical protein
MAAGTEIDQHARPVRQNRSHRGKELVRPRAVAFSGYFNALQLLTTANPTTDIKTQIFPLANPFSAGFSAIPIGFHSPVSPWLSVFPVVHFYVLCTREIEP